MDYFTLELGNKAMDFKGILSFVHKMRVFLKVVCPLVCVVMTPLLEKLGRARSIDLVTRIGIVICIATFRGNCVIV